MNERYKALADGILAQGIKDYTYALKRDDERVKRECESFFLSDWGQMLSEGMGEHIIKRVRELVEAEREEKRKKRRRKDGGCEVDQDNDGYIR